MKTVRQIADDLGISRLAVHRRIVRLELTPIVHGRTRVLTESQVRMISNWKPKGTK